MTDKVPLPSPILPSGSLPATPFFVPLPKVLVQVAVSDLLQGLNVVDGNEVAVQVHELNGHLLEAAVGQQVALDALQRLVGVVVRLWRTLDRKRIACMRA